MGVDSEKSFQLNSTKPTKSRPISRTSNVGEHGGGGGGRLSRTSLHKHSPRLSKTNTKDSNLTDVIDSVEKENTVTSLPPVISSPAEINLDSSDDDDSDDSKDFPGPTDPKRAIKLYTSACRRFGITPSKKFLRSVSTGAVNVSHQVLGPEGARAIAIGLATSLSVSELNIPGNEIGAEGMKHIADMVTANGVIKSLDVSDNHLGSEGAFWLAKILEDCDCLCKLKAANNQFEEESAKYLGEALKKNTTVRILDLSGNHFHGISGALLGKALADNEILENVNLSWNHLRGPGIAYIAEGIKENVSIKNLDLSMNGLGRHGTDALGHALRHNSILRTINLRACRINVDGLLLFFTRLVGNETLKSIDLADNPITNEDAIMAMRVVLCNPTIMIENLGFESVVVSKEFLEVRDQIQETRPAFKANFGGIMRAKGIPKKFLKEMMTPKVGDPLEMLVKFVKDNGLRIMDLFVRLDTDKSCSISKEEFRTGIVNAGLNLSEHQMDSLIEKLDTDGDGEIDFAELVDAYRNYQRRLLRKQGKDSRAGSRGTSPADKMMAVPESKDLNRKGVNTAKPLSRQNSRPGSPFAVSMSGPLGNPNELVLDSEYLRAGETVHRPSIHDFRMSVPLLNVGVLRDKLTEAKSKMDFSSDDDST